MNCNTQSISIQYTILYVVCALYIYDDLGLLVNSPILFVGGGYCTILPLLSVDNAWLAQKLMNNVFCAVGHLSVMHNKTIYTCMYINNVSIYNIDIDIDIDL